MERAPLSGFKLSPLQEEAWTSQQQSPVSRAHCTVRIEGPVDEQALADALRQVVARHEILRTTYHRRAGIKFPFQVIDESPKVAWDRVDLTHVAPDEKQDRIAGAVRDEETREFDLERGPALRACLLTITPLEHLLVISLPSACGDARTLLLLVQEAANGLGAETGFQPESEPLQYADYSEWLREQIETQDGHTQGASVFWNGLDLAAIPRPSFPLASKADLNGPFTPVTHTVPIARDVVDGIRRLALEHGTSPAVVTLACWNLLVARLTGQPKFVMGVGLDGRTQDELNQAFGLFRRTLPVPCAIDLDQRWVDFVAQFDATRQQAALHQDYLPMRLLDAKGIANAGLPLECEWIDAVPSSFVAGGRWAVTGVSDYTASFDLKLTLLQLESECLAQFQYDPRRLQLRDVQEIAECFATILASALDQPTATIGELRILSATRRQELLVDYNRTREDYLQEACLHHLFEDQAKRTPDRPALVCESQRYTYASLNARANQLAHHLRRIGVGPGVAVGLCMERSAEMIVALLGILKAGGAYVPIHPEQPKSRLDHQLAESQSPVLVTEAALLNRLPEFGGRILCLDRDGASLDVEPVTDPERVTSSEGLAYVIYTSGSTGVPKGVAVRHRNLVNYTSFICKRLHLTPDEGLHFATVSTLSADLGNTCIFPSLVSGGCLHVIAHETSMDGDLFATYVAENPLDVLKITPSHLASILAAAQGSRALPRRYLILGGETVSWELVTKVRAACNCTIVNHYGPTETTVGALTYLVESRNDVHPSASTVPIGRPIANTCLYILDARMEPVPVGVAGELWIGGDGVAQGYLNQPEQTAERFVNDPFSWEPGARLYRTGDLARYLPDRNVEFLGRIDHQVKIRGFRVELPEIEAVLNQHAAIRQAIVITREDRPGDQRLVAYVVASGVNKPEPDVLKAALAERLPDYMIPSAILFVNELPLTANGKVDRKALPAPEEHRGSASVVAPRNPVEEALASIWREVLNLEQVSVHDDFFDLGGHSLMATQVILRIRNVLELQLPLRVIFETPTVAGLGETIIALMGEDDADVDLDRIVAEVEGMSDEEVQRLLMSER